MATYYVDPAGNNGGAGSAVDPWRTIVYSLTKLKNSDTLIVNNGTYYETVDINDKSKITIQAAKGASPVISGANTRFVKPSGAWTSYGIENGWAVYYATFTPDVFEIQGWYPDSTRLWTYKTWVTFTSFRSGEGIYLDTATDRLYIALNRDIDPNTIGLWISTDDHVVRIYNSDHITLKDLTIQCGGESALQIRYGCHDVAVLNCTTRYAMRGIWLKYYTGHNNQYNIVINGCRIYDTYKRHEWSWNQIKDLPIEEMQTSGIAWATGGTGGEICNCTVYGWFDGIGAGTEYSTAPYQDGLLIHDNTIYDCRDDAICLERYSRNTRVYNNLIYDCYLGFASMPRAGGTTYVYRNRFIADRISYYDDRPLLYQCARGTKLGTYDRVPCQDIYFYHNTWWSRDDCIHHAVSATPMRGHKWYNNIFYTTRQGYSFADFKTQVAASADDAEQFGDGSIDLITRGLQLGTCNVGIRFQDITIARGTKIVSAILRLTAKADVVAGGYCDVYGEAVDNAAAFTSDLNNITSRTTTTATHHWHFGAWTTESSYRIVITDIIQEIVDRQGWSSGNDLAILLLNNKGPEHNAYSYDHETSQEPELEIEYLLAPGRGSGNCVEGTGLASDGIVFDYNLYYGTGVGTKIKYWNSETKGSYKSLADARLFYSGWEENGIESGPRMNLSSYPYPLTITATSPAYGAGRTLPKSWPDSVTPTGTPDIGYYEVPMGDAATVMHYYGRRRV